MIYTCIIYIYIYYYLQGLYIYIITHIYIYMLMTAILHTTHKASLFSGTHPLTYLFSSCPLWVCLYHHLTISQYHPSYPTNLFPTLVVAQATGGYQLHRNPALCSSCLRRSQGVASCQVHREPKLEVTPWGLQCHDCTETKSSPNIYNIACSLWGLEVATYRFHFSISDQYFRIWKFPLIRCIPRV